MSTEITTAMIRSYRDGIMLDAQQMFARLRGRVRSEMVKGEQYFWDKVGKTGMTKRAARHQDTVITDTPHSRRMLVTDTYDVADFIDRRDLVRVLNDPGSAYAQSMAAAAGRTIDQVIIDAFFASADTGKNGTTPVPFPTSTHQVIAVGTALATSQVIQAKKILDEFENNPAVRRHACVKAAQFEDLLSETGASVANNDYNTVKALVRGEVNTWVGFDWERSELLATNGSSEVEAPFWSEDAMVLGIGYDIETAVETRADKNGATQIRLSMDIGASRDNEDGVVRVLCGT